MYDLDGKKAVWLICIRMLIFELYQFASRTLWYATLFSCCCCCCVSLYKIYLCAHLVFVCGLSILLRLNFFSFFSFYFFVSFDLKNDESIWSRLNDSVHIAYKSKEIYAYSCESVPFFSSINSVCMNICCSFFSVVIRIRYEWNDSTSSASFRYMF